VKVEWRIKRLQRVANPVWNIDVRQHPKRGIIEVRTKSPNLEFGGNLHQKREENTHADASHFCNLELVRKMQ
jgi:hypothetical protein